jgi:hydroxyacylglutathione hydrolase
MPTIRVEVIPYYSDNYSYLIRHPESKHTALVDCGDARSIAARLEKLGWELDVILIAHDHIDHTSGLGALRAEYRGARVYTPKKTGFGPSVTAVTDGDKIPLGPIEIEAVSVPFHTLNCTSYYVDSCLFVSDSLFSGGCGRLFEGTREDLMRAMDRFASFARSTRIYFGHEYTLDNLRFAQEVEPENSDITDYLAKCEVRRLSGKPTTPTTLGRELKVNPFLRINEEPVIDFVDPRRQYSRVERIGLLRKAKDRY